MRELGGGVGVVQNGAFEAKRWIFQSLQTISCTHLFIYFSFITHSLQLAMIIKFQNVHMFSDLQK